MSDLWKLANTDFIKGFLVTILSAALTIIYGAIQGGGSVDWDQVFKVSTATGIAYLLKNLGTDSSGKILGKIG